MSKINGKAIYSPKGKAGSAARTTAPTAIANAASLGTLWAHR